MLVALAALALAGACSKAPPEERRPLQNVSKQPARPRPTALAKLPGLAIARPAWAERDCRLSSVLRARFGAAEVEPCGALPNGAPPEELETARACVASAIAAGRPFVYEQGLHGTDSRTDMGLVGVLEHGQLVVYRARHDSDPCGGSCPENGHTLLYRCGSLDVPDMLGDCLRNVADCYKCQDATELDDCVFGGKPP